MPYPTRSVAAGPQRPKICRFVSRCVARSPVAQSASAYFIGNSFTGETGERLLVTNSTGVNPEQTSIQDSGRFHAIAQLPMNRFIGGNRTGQ